MAIEATRDRASADRAPAARRRWFFDLSIRVKLPLAVVTLVALTSAALTSLAYMRVKTFVVGTASDRLTRAAIQVSDLISKSAHQRGVALQQIADAPITSRYLSGASTGGDEAALRGLLVQASRVGGGAANLGLFDAAGARLIGDADQPPAPSPAARAQLAADPRAIVINPLQRSAQGELFYTMVVAARRDGAVAGYIVERRVTGGSGETLAVMSGLIGTQARLSFGNAADGLWTDFEGPRLSAGAASSTGVVGVAGHEALLAGTAPIAGTPWATGVGFPFARVLQPIHRFLFEALAITVCVIVLGAVAAWAGSRRVTVPLARVTEAAEAIADGRPAVAVTVDRADEIARLAGSFNRMADRVAESRQALERLVQDLEHRVRARTDALESANRELEAFSYSVSHDLRAPLRAVTGFSKILLEDHAQQLSPDARECVDVIARRSRHMGQLIDDLLAFSRLGRAPISRESIDMGAFVRSVVDDLHRSDPASPIVWDLQPLPPAVGEPALMQQVLVNLIHNAVKYSRTRPEPRITVGCADTPHGPAYFVRDNGVGFDMRYADRLFGVFQRLHAQDQFEGTGVGLAIVHRVVSRHGGQVWAEAAPDRGATFFFTVPSAARGAAA